MLHLLNSIPFLFEHFSYKCRLLGTGAYYVIHVTSVVIHQPALVGKTFKKELTIGCSYYTENCCHEKKAHMESNAWALIYHVSKVFFTKEVIHCIIINFIHHRYKYQRSGWNEQNPKTLCKYWQRKMKFLNIITFDEGKMLKLLYLHFVYLQKPKAHTLLNSN